jgi:hypothetical protein
MSIKLFWGIDFIVQVEIVNYFFVAVVIELRALGLLGKHSTS